MRSMRCAIVAAAAVLTLTGFDAASAEPRLAGTFADSSVALCHITATSGEPIALNSQSQAVSSTVHFDGAGGLTVEFVTNVANVPAGTRGTTAGTCVGTYVLHADNVVTTNVACDSDNLDAAGNPTGSTNHVPSIQSRFLNLKDTLVRVQTVPLEETVTTTTPSGVTTMLFRKCSRVGTMHVVR